MLLQLFGIGSMERPDFIALKTVVAGAIAAAAMMVAGYRALGDGVTPEKPLGTWHEQKIRRV